MSNNQLTPEEIKYIEFMQNNSPVVRYLRTKDSIRFGVGDILIKKTKKNDRWVTSSVSHVSDMPKRYVCIHEDEHGIKYIKALTSFGEKLPGITMISEIDDWVKYEIDPDYADHMILNGDEPFDFSYARREEKKRRNAITNKNKKIMLKIKSLQDAENFIFSLKPGDKIWYGENIPNCAVSDPLTFNYRHQQNNSPAPWARSLLTMSVSKNNSVIQLTSQYIVGWTVTTKEPYSYETI